MTTTPELAEDAVPPEAGARPDTDPRPGATCPICGSTEFKPHRSRGRIRCVGCNSLPRARMAWLLIERVARLRPDARIAHFAPDRSIAGRLSEKYGEGYEAYDLSPAKWSRQLLKVNRLDLCTGLPTLEDGAYDLVMHHHVMEHLPCNETIVLQRLQAKLRPGGFHVFSFPIAAAGYYRSDINPNLSNDERVARFNQLDHVRRWGRMDFERTIGMIFDIPVTYDVTTLLGDEVLAQAHVLPRQRVIGGGAVFIVDSDGKVPAPDPALAAAPASAPEAA